MDFTGPLISIILPVYNVRDYLSQCLDSVLNQTYMNIEIMIIDDGSTDGSGDICDTISETDERITVFHTENRGLSAARNYGLDHISEKSEYVMFLDSDDWMEKNTVELLYNAAKRFHADLVCCQYTYEYIEKSMPAVTVDRLEVFEKHSILHSYICEGYIGEIAWNKLYNRNLFAYIRYPMSHTFEDIATTYKIMKIANVVVVMPECLIHYRIRKKSISRQHDMKYLMDCWYAYNDKYKGLVNAVSDNKSKQVLAGNCVNAIGRMWRWYYGCDERERKEAAAVMDTMQQFACDHYSEIILSHECSIYQKCICLCSRYRNPIMMRMLYLFALIHRILKEGKEYV